MSCQWVSQVSNLLHPHFVRSLFGVCACWTDVEFAKSLNVGLRLALLDVGSRFYKVLVSAVVVGLLLVCSHVCPMTFSVTRMYANGRILPTVVLIQ